MISLHSKHSVQLENVRKIPHCAAGMYIGMHTSASKEQQANTPGNLVLQLNEGVLYVGMLTA